MYIYIYVMYISIEINGKQILLKQYNLEDFCIKVLLNLKKFKI